MTLLTPSFAGHGGPRSEPAALLSWVRRRFVRWLTGTGMKETRWSYAVKGELLVPVEARGSDEQKLELHDTGGATLDLHYHFPGAGLRIGAALASDEDDAFAPGKTGRKLWAPADAEGDEQGGKLQSRAGLKRALLVDLHQLFGRRSLGGPASGAMMLLGVDPHCAAWVRKIGFHSQRLRQLVVDGRGVESGFSFEDLRDDVDTSFQESGFQAALFFDGVAGGRAGVMAYFGEITNATAEDHTSDAPDVAAAVQALSSLGKLAKTVTPMLAPSATPSMSLSTLSSVATPSLPSLPSLPVTPPLPPPMMVAPAPEAGGLASVPAPPTLPSPPRVPPVVNVGDLPPLVADDPHNVFFASQKYLDGRANGAPELKKNGSEGGGFLYDADANELTGPLTLYRVGRGGPWWGRKPPPPTLAEWRQRDAVCETWSDDSVAEKLIVMHIPAGVKAPKCWEGVGNAAYELDASRKVKTVYHGQDNQLAFGDTRLDPFVALTTTGDPAKDAAERAIHHANGKITITSGHKTPWVPPPAPTPPIKSSL